MIEFLIQQQLPQPNKMEHTQPAVTENEFKLFRSEYKEATSRPPTIDYKRFLPNRENINPAPQIEGENENEDARLSLQITKESKSLIKKWIEKFLPKNRIEVIQDIEVCKNQGGDLAIVTNSGGDAEIECSSDNGEIIQIENTGSSPTILRELNEEGVEAKIGLKLVTNKYGKLVIGYTQEKFPIETKVLFEQDGFVLRDQTTQKRFYEKIKSEKSKYYDSLANDVNRCNLKNQNASLTFKNLDGDLKIICQNGNGKKDIIDFDMLSVGTQKIVNILNMASKEGYDTKITLNPNYPSNREINYEQIFRPN